MAAKKPEKMYGDYFKEATAGMAQQPSPEQDDEELSLDVLNGRFSHLRPTNKAVTRLHVVMENGDIRTFQFVNLMGGSFSITEHGHQFTLDFAVPGGIERIVVEGRCLFKSYDYCQLHRWSCLRRDDRGFAADKEPIIFSVGINFIKQSD